MNLSLAGWSLHKLFRAADAPLKLLDFPKFAKETFGLDAVELNNLYFDNCRPPYFDQLRTAADAAGVKLLNIAVDEHGELGGLDRVGRAVGVANYARWVPIAGYLGIDAIRVNSGGKHDLNHAAQVECCTDSFRRLCDVGRQYGVRILVENHGGLSHDPDFIVELIRKVRLTHGDEAVGVLADFGNWPDETDRYAALGQILPYATAVHAKVNEIDPYLGHPRFDLGRCVDLCRDAGYDGYLGVEYEGQAVEPVEGVRRGVKLLRQLIA